MTRWGGDLRGFGARETWGGHTEQRAISDCNGSGGNELAR